MEDIDSEALLAAARSALRFAHVPYSQKANGAALLSEDGRVFTGCTIEISNYASSVCAAKVALVKAVSEGAISFRAIAVTGEAVDIHFLCGDCRQSLAEFGVDTIVLCDIDPYAPLVLRQLLPYAFVLNG